MRLDHVIVESFICLFSSVSSLVYSIPVQSLHVSRYQGHGSSAYICTDGPGCPSIECIGIKTMISHFKLNKIFYSLQYFYDNLFVITQLQIKTRFIDITDTICQMLDLFIFFLPLPIAQVAQIKNIHCLLMKSILTIRIVQYMSLYIITFLSYFPITKSRYQQR